jgi:HYR domain/LGFP repeat
MLLTSILPMPTALALHICNDSLMDQKYNDLKSRLGDWVGDQIQNGSLVTGGLFRSYVYSGPDSIDPNGFPIIDANILDIYCNDTTGQVFAIHGLIRQKWISMGGGEAGLGYPISDEQNVPSGNGIFQQFENGYIYSVQGRTYETIGGPDTTPTITIDPTPPIVKEISDPSATGVPVDYIPYAYDTEDGNLTAAVNCGEHPSGTLFPIGDTPVTCTAFDSVGNLAQVNFVVTVARQQQLQEQPQQQQLQEQQPPAGGGNQTAGGGNQTAGGGNQTAGGGNQTAGGGGGQQPQLEVPESPVIAEATNSSGAVVNYSANATGSDGSPFQVECNPPTGTIFPIGDTPVTCTVHSVGNPVNGNFTVEVQDTKPPQLEVPESPVREEATSSLGATVEYVDKVNAVDVVDGAPTIECNPPTGTIFPIGDTKVTCSATDAAQNKASQKEFVVTVAQQPPPPPQQPPPPPQQPPPSTGGGGGGGGQQQPSTGGGGGGQQQPSTGGGGGGQQQPPAVQSGTTPPIVIVPQSPLKVTTTSSSGIVVNYQTSARSSTGGPLVTSCAPPPGFVFPVGNTTVTCTAQDNNGNRATKAFTVAVAQPTNATARANNLPPSNIKINVNVLVVVIDNNQYDLTVISSSNVSNLAFNTEGKQISFVADGRSGTRGFTDVPVGKVLNGPYNVTFDGARISNFTTRTDDEGITNIRLNYTHSAHDIAIIGKDIVGQNATSIPTTPPTTTSPFNNPILIAGIGAAVAGGVGALVVWRLKRRKKETDEFIP